MVTVRVTDRELLDRLDRLYYVFASYRLVMGIEDPPLGEDSLWPRFVEGADGSGEWFMMFVEFLKSGRINVGVLTTMFH